MALKNIALRFGHRLLTDTAHTHKLVTKYSGGSFRMSLCQGCLAYSYSLVVKVNSFSDASLLVGRLSYLILSNYVWRKAQFGNLRNVIVGNSDFLLRQK